MEALRCLCYNEWHEIQKSEPCSVLYKISHSDIDQIPPKMSVSSVVRLIKTNTGKAMRKHFPFLDKVYWGVKGIWSIGYFVSTVGISEEIIQKYIELQGREDSGQAQLEL